MRSSPPTTTKTRPKPSYDRRLREKVEAREVGERKRARETRRQAERQQIVNNQAAANTQAWAQYVDARITAKIEEWWSAVYDPLIETIGETIATHQRAVRKQTKGAIDEAKREFETMLSRKLEALKQRVMMHVDESINTHIAQTTERTNALGDMLARERQDWRSEIKSVVDTAQCSSRTNGVKLAERLADPMRGRGGVASDSSGNSPLDPMSD